MKLPARSVSWAGHFAGRDLFVGEDGGWHTNGDDYDVAVVEGVGYVFYFLRRRRIATEKSRRKRDDGGRPRLVRDTPTAACVCIYYIWLYVRALD